jgi:hypothetical protein
MSSTYSHIKSESEEQQNFHNIEILLSVNKLKKNKENN